MSRYDAPNFRYSKSICCIDCMHYAFDLDFCEKYDFDVAHEDTGESMADYKVCDDYEAEE